MIRAVSYSEILNDPAAPLLLAEYAAECSISELGTPRPQPELYSLLEKSGGMQAFGVYDGTVLVGFAVVLIWVLPHYGKKIAATESIFMSKTYRTRGIGTYVLDFLADYARENGCVAFQYTAPVDSRFDRILSVFYRHTNNVYVRKL